MKTITLLIFAVISFSIQSSMANEFLPSTIYQLDTKFTHHVIVVEKSTHSLFLYKHGEDSPELIKKYKILTGKFIGDKTTQGDKKTPEGIYFFQKFHPSERLVSKYGEYGKIYGAGAFTTNYPNEMDRRYGKTGGGIWLHSTDDDKRVSLGLDSKGCVVAIDQDLKDISQYIDLSNTPMVIVQDLHFQTKETWLKNKTDIRETVTTWMDAWKNKNIDAYIESYSKSDFIHPRKGRYNAFKNYKRRVFSRDDKPTIDFSNISILHNGDYVVVTMVQDYNSPFIKDIGKKTLYLKKNANYKWKIVSEDWSNLKEEEQDIAFTPKMRYFGAPIEKELANDSGSI
jgi:murein L,D-transpeptidase YafK